jgi:acetyltransferase-like isoleucine patch superfamily enzyme
VVKSVSFSGMRKIDNKSITIFISIATTAVTSAIFLSNQWVEFANPADSKLVLKIFSSFFLTYIHMILFYRVFLYFKPLKIGFYKENSDEQFVYNIYVLFYLLFFNPLLPTLLIPVPLMRVIYQFLGARFGDNSYTSGVILDPPLVSVGSNTILGFDSVICPHAVEGNSIYFAPIEIGSHVTVGMRAILMAGVKVEDGAIVAAGAIVLKDTHIKSDEIWVGAPAKKLKDKHAILSKV